MMAQVCNSHGFHNSWVSAKYHHEVFRSIVTQVEEQYTGNCIVIDHTWISKFPTIDDFVKVYANVDLTDVIICSLWDY